MSASDVEVAGGTPPSGSAVVSRPVSHAPSAPDAADLAAIIDRLERRLANPDVHRDVIEAAVRSAWVRYDNARITTYRSILTERDAYKALARWFA